MVAQPWLKGVAQSHVVTYPYSLDLARPLRRLTQRHLNVLNGAIEPVRTCSMAPLSWL